MKISIVLVSPRNPQNIGAAARAMANFALDDLRVVAPYPPVWKDVVSAVHADYIIKNARIFKTLPEALHDADFIFATTALKNRRAGQEIVPLTKLRDFLTGRNARHVSIVFGQEKTGLTSGDIALANAVLNIPTTAKTPSINLAQAVILCCYELSRGRIAAKKNTAKKAPTFKEKQIALESLSMLLDKLDLPPTLGRRVRREKLLDLASNTSLSKENIFFVNSLIARIMRRLKT